MLNNPWLFLTYLDEVRFCRAPMEHVDTRFRQRWTAAVQARSGNGSPQAAYGAHTENYQEILALPLLYNKGFNFVLEKWVTLIGQQQHWPLARKCGASEREVIPISAILPIKSILYLKDKKKA